MNKVTIHDVAAAAGVSYQTVSRVINQRPDVAEETRERILRIIQELDYQPSAIARSLTLGQSTTLGVVASGLEYFGPSQTLVGVERYATQMGYSLLLHLVKDAESSEVDNILDELLSHQVSGIIWTVPEISANKVWIEEIIPQLPVPIVFTNASPRPGASVVQIDNILGGRMAAEHLLAQGYQNIGVISGPLSWVAAQERLEGWRQVMQEHGKPVEEYQIVEGNWSTDSGESGFEQLQSQFPGMDAVFACNDQMALGVLQVIYRQHMRVPRDLALLGFDDIPSSAYFFPPLTTIRQDLIELGGLAMQALGRLIENYHKRNAPRQSEIQLVPPELIIRKSTEQSSGN
jgi:LacI family transcriptional regulator